MEPKAKMCKVMPCTPHTSGSRLLVLPWKMITYSNVIFSAKED